jgi:hypothetical protein
MIEILIPQHLQADVGQYAHWDAYFVDLKLKDGRVKRRIVAREGVAILSSAVHGPNDPSNLDFSSEDILAVRPSSMFVPFFFTELARQWRKSRE